MEEEIIRIGNKSEPCRQFNIERQFSTYGSLKKMVLMNVAFIVLTEYLGQYYDCYSNTQIQAKHSSIRQAKLIDF